MKLVYQPGDKPKFGQLIVLAIQQLLAIMAATLVVPVIVGNEMSPAAALFGAGVGTLVYVLFTQRRSPVFLGSSFAFINSMFAAFAGASTVALGYLGLIIGAVMAGLVYVIIALVVKKVGVNWINRLMPPVVIGPTVAIIGLSLAGNAVGDAQAGEVYVDGVATASPLLCVLCALVTLFVVVLASTFGKKTAKLIPFIIGIGAGYAVSALFTIVGHWNAWFDGMIYLNSPDKYPLQTFLKMIEATVSLGSTSSNNVEYMREISDRTLRSAQLVIAMVPVLCVYPFLQKYFTKGIVMGSVKG